MLPTLIEGTVTSDGSVDPAPATTPVRVVSAETAAQVTGMLEEVVGPGGTAPQAAIPG